MIDNLITIYDKNDAKNLTEHLYDTQGLGALSDWLTATVSNKLNGAEIFQGTYPISGTNADLIIEGRIIQCYVDENRAKQRLRIYYAKTSVIGNTIEVKAEPIFNDIRKSVLNKYDSGTGKITASQAWQNAKVLAKPVIPSQFSFISLVDTLANVKIEKANFLEFFGGKEGSILDRFHGEFLKDNNTLRHEKRLGTDHRIKAIYTKNLTGLDLEIDAQSVLVGVYPFISSSSEGEVEITLPEEVIFTDYAEDYPAGYVSFVDFKDKTTDLATLREAAKEWLKTNIDKQKPQVSGSIELVPLRHQRGYEKFVDLEKVSMGDGVDVYHPQLKVNMSARIVEYTFNVLTNSYDKLVVGNVKTNFLENTENNVSNLIIEVHAQETTQSDVGELFYQIKPGGGFRIVDTKGNLVLSTYDNGTNAGAWLSFSTKEYHWFGTRRQGGDAILEHMSHTPFSWICSVNSFTMEFDNTGGLDVGGHTQLNNTQALFRKNVRVDKDLRVYGKKNSTVNTETYGQRLLNAYETPEYYFADYGEAITGEDCKVRVDIDPIFAETVNLARYMTHVTPTKLVLCAVTREEKEHFIIETSEPNVLVRWNVIAHRLGYEDIRLTEDIDHDVTYADQVHFDL